MGRCLVESPLCRVASPGFDGFGKMAEPQGAARSTRRTWMHRQVIQLRIVSG